MRFVAVMRVLGYVVMRFAAVMSALGYVVMRFVCGYGCFGVCGYAVCMRLWSLWVILKTSEQHNHKTLKPNTTSEPCKLQRCVV